jgi:hypothetical protein
LHSDENFEKYYNTRWYTDGCFLLGHPALSLTLALSQRERGHSERLMIKYCFDTNVA